MNYTNAAFLIQEGFKLPEDGSFPASMRAQTDDLRPGIRGASEGVGRGPARRGLRSLAGSIRARVFQLLKQHYSRYTPEMVERITGIPQDAVPARPPICSLPFARTATRRRPRTIIYAVGWTQHSSGTQTIRTAAMLQLLMGNVGRAGGGVNALRGHSNIQGATDMAGIFDILPGYLKMPTPADTDFKAYAGRASRPSPPSRARGSRSTTGPTRRKFAVSFLKAMYGDAAKKENDWAFHYLPKIDRNYSWTEIWDDMYRGHIKGLLAFGMNGVAIGPNSQKNIDALKKADWLVVCEIYPDETSEFWKSPGITPDEMKQIQTTVYRLAGRGLRGEGRHVRQLRALAAMEERRRAAARARRSWIRRSWRGSS